ncbi:RNA 2'-phosphotransferase [Longitalea arenae]|uniref:RNA 2'-phosphotransferase n=1 Tax=Longitalea arenae TaxID=2812558 RepID=UPI00196743F1|nr:RNA 2'-phosphotransferase [Longitalea arenae]
MEKQIKNIGKFLSLVLRHEPQHMGLTLNEEGWASVPELIEKFNQRGVRLDFAMLQLVVDTNDKKRFSFNEDKTRIRASQGHTVEVDLNLPEQTPPEFLYHGAADKYINAIRQHGLQKMKRHHVHLTADIETARQVGQRRGRPVILVIKALALHEQGHKFYLSANGVWLTDFVPPAFILFE